MVPADQRLDAEQFAGAELDLGLVVEAEFVVAQAFAQALLDLETLDDTLAEIGRILGGAVVAKRLGAIHRDVAVGEQGRYVDAIVRIHRDTDTGRHRDLVPL